MIVAILGADPAYGPRDLGECGEGDVLVVLGEPDRERDFGRWAGAIGSAVLRGAEVRRR